VVVRVVGVVVVVFMVVLDLLLMLLLLMVLVLLVMMWRHVLVMTSLRCHVTPMIPLVVHIVVLESSGRGSHRGRPTNAHYHALSMPILARSRKHHTVTR